jgi:tetratricopeptide (TPR) repeat protein
MPRCTTIAVVLAASAMLGGCASASSFFSFRWIHNGPRMAKAQSAPAFLALGKQELDNGAYGSAIESFRLALATGENPAEALNGTGVAYAQLGRPDVAETLFLQAQRREPNNPRFARNLVLLRLSHELPAPQMAALTPSPMPVVVAPALPVEVASSDRLQRLPSGEIALRTFAPDASTKAPMAWVAHPAHRLAVAEGGAALAADSADHPKSQTIIVDPRFKPLLRFTLDKPAPVGAGGRPARAGS